MIRVTVFHHFHGLGLGALGAQLRSGQCEAIVGVRCPQEEAEEWKKLPV